MTVAERAAGAARWLAARGIREGSRVALDVPDVLPWFLGADLLGAASLVVEPSWTPRDRAAVLADARPDLVVSGVDAPTGPPLRRAGHGGTSFYLPTTSGSSGSPKVLARTRDSWRLSFAALGPLPGPVLVPGPLSSSLFLFGALHALWCEQPIRTLDRWDPERAASTDAATVHLVPAMLSALLAVLERRPCSALRTTLRTVVCGGAHLGDDVRARFAGVLPDAELIEYYGSAEHSLIAIRRGAGGLRPVAGVDLDVRDGVVWVRSPLAYEGRLDGGRLVPAGEWSTVGDRVSVTPSGSLVVHGRAGAVVHSGGRLVLAERVEAALRTAPGVGDVLVTGTPHPRFGELVTAVVEGDAALRDLRAVARELLAPANRPRRWLRTRELPRTPSGKPARALVTERLAAGTLPAEPMT